MLVASDRRQRGRERVGQSRLRGSALLDDDDEAKIDARIDAAAQSRRLYGAMDRLPEAERAVLELVALDELSVAEAAAAVGVRAVTARVRLHRARRKLRAELEAAPTQPNRTRRTDREPGQKPNDDFESRLLAHLNAVVAERGAAEAERRRRPNTSGPPGAAAAHAWLWAAASPLAAVAAALVVSAGGDNTSTAFAVEPQPGGGVTIKVYNLDDPDGVEPALEEAGINSQVNWLDAGMICREPHYKPSTVEMPALPFGQPRSFTGIGLATLPPTATEGTPPPITIGIGNVQQQRELFEGIEQGDASSDDMPHFIVDPSAFRPDQTLVISGAPVGPGSPYADAFNAPDPPKAGTEMNVRVAEGEVEPCEPVPMSG